MSGSPPAEPAPSEADVFDKYLQKAKVTAHFYQEGHASKMAVVVSHLVDQLYACFRHYKQANTAIHRMDALMLFRYTLGGLQV